MYSRQLMRRKCHMLRNLIAKAANNSVDMNKDFDRKRLYYFWQVLEELDFPEDLINALKNEL
jgi:hypothetical protein